MKEAVDFVLTHEGWVALGFVVFFLGGIFTIVMLSRNKRFID